MKNRTSSFIFMCLLTVLPLTTAGYLAPVDAALSAVFDSMLSPLSPGSNFSGPMPRELALRRVVDRTDALLRSEGRRIDRSRLIEIARIADRASLRYRLSPALIFSVIHTESGFQRDAMSPDGAIGLMQVQLPTAQRFASSVGLKTPTGMRLFDPEVNILLGTGYLRFLIDRFGNLRIALAAYHIGPAEIERRMASGEPFSDRYGGEIRVREAYAPAVPAPPVAPPVLRATVAQTQG